MKQIVERLQEIESQMETIGENIRKEEQVYRAELEERQRLGLTGDAAIKHYNEWMLRNGMRHLMVEDPAAAEIEELEDMLYDEDTAGIEEYLSSDTAEKAKNVYIAWSEKYLEETAYVRLNEPKDVFVDKVASQAAALYLQGRSNGMSVSKAHKTASWQLYCVLDRYRIKL